MPSQKPMIRTLQTVETSNAAVSSFTIPIYNGYFDTDAANPQGNANLNFYNNLLGSNCRKEGNWLAQVAVSKAGAKYDVQLGYNAAVTKLSLNNSAVIITNGGGNTNYNDNCSLANSPARLGVCLVNPTEYAITYTFISKNGDSTKTITTNLPKNSYVWWFCDKGSGTQNFWTRETYRYYYKGVQKNMDNRVFYLGDKTGTNRNEVEYKKGDQIIKFKTWNIGNSNAADFNNNYITAAETQKNF